MFKATVKSPVKSPTRSPVPGKAGIGSSSRGVVEVGENDALNWGCVAA